MICNEDAAYDAQDDAAFAAACSSRKIGEIELTAVVVENQHLADVVAVCLEDQSRLICEWKPSFVEDDTIERRILVNDVVIPVIDNGNVFVADLSATEPSFRDRYAGAVSDLIALSDAAVLPTTREVFNEQMRQFQQMTPPEQVGVLNGLYPTDEAIYEGWSRAHQDVVDELNEVASNAVHS